MVRSLVRFYYVAAVGAMLCLNGYNVGIDGSSLSHIFKFDFYFVGSATLALTLFLHHLSRKRLLPIARLMERNRDAADESKAFRVLTRFPSEVLLSVLGFGVLASAAYHTLEICWFRIRPFNELVIRHLIVEQLFNAVLAIVFYTAVRTFLRPTIRKLSTIEAIPHGARSFVAPWMFAFTASMLATLIPVFWFIRNMEMRGMDVDGYAVLLIFLFAFAVGGIVMFMLFSHFQKEITALTEAVKSFSRSGHLSRRLKISAISDDEFGQLTTLFNELHARAAKEYEELQSDLRLAAAVQRMLLPEERHDFEGVAVRCYYESAKEVGGDFHDCSVLPDGRTALAIGEVSGKGLPAALIMSATLMLLRSELRGGGTAGDMLTRLNKDIMEAAGGDVLVNLGLAVIEPASGTVEYASAGQASPFVLRHGKAALMATGSLPLGASNDSVYVNSSWKLDHGDRIFLYTSGLIEQFRRTGQETGFAGFLRALEELPSGAGLDETADHIVERLHAAQHPSDRTLIVAEYTGAGTGKERLYA
ncbi:PP2C family protein-serine/threonine phosphatase [Paenibacillus thermotolerans]|uniref:PP2C family protein-serine/threonine phosphatase n=1 Tax=Paenibacillus thermotolerans TaxID=3027807 RepID=UPI002368A77C|nr:MULTISPECIES: SpoIIE family protein phosphatase [unclassified Paenibacillus]